jgi:hypothetical protein
MNVYVRWVEQPTVVVDAYNSTESSEDLLLLGLGGGAGLAGHAARREGLSSRPSRFLQRSAPASASGTSVCDTLPKNASKERYDQGGAERMLSLTELGLSRPQYNGLIPASLTCQLEPRWR